MEKEKVIGFLKFSDFNVEKGCKKNHFEKLIDGELFFANYSWFGENGTKAQMAKEGSAERVEFLKVAGSSVTINLRYSMVNPIGIKYKSSEEIIINSTMLYSLRERDLVKKDKVKEIMSTLFPDSDVVIYPEVYKKKDESKNHYEFDKINIKFQSDSANWKICCFVMITENDITLDRKLKTEFLESLKKRDSERGSIAYDENEKERPWIMLPPPLLGKLFRKYPNLNCGPIEYYARDKYPFTINQIKQDPNYLILAKEDSYKNQKEFRIFVGGPNNSFSSIEGNILKINWRKNITYGTNFKKLENTTLNANYR